MSYYRHDDDDIWMYVIIFGVLMLMLIVIELWTNDEHDKIVEACESKGGVYKSFKGGTMCVKKDSIIELGGN